MDFFHCILFRSYDKFISDTIFCVSPYVYVYDIAYTIVYLHEMKCQLLGIQYFLNVFI